MFSYSNPEDLLTTVPSLPKARGPITGALFAGFAQRFGDPNADYQEALDRHYVTGPPPNWRDPFVWAYATMHPAEDWAETFAHYLHIRDTIDLHIRDTIDTGAAFGFAPAGVTAASPLSGE